MVKIDNNAKARPQSGLNEADIVFEEMSLQVSSDGVDFEQSTAYHRLVLEAFMTSFLLL